MLTAGWVVWNPPQIVQSVFGLAMFALFLAGVVHFFRRVIYNFRETRAELHLNPFL
jgi:hypothetical protein